MRAFNAMKLAARRSSALSRQFTGRQAFCYAGARRFFSDESGKATLESNITASTDDPYSVEPGKILFPSASNYANLRATHHVEFAVGNAKQAAMYYQQCFGFQPLAYKGLETGSREVVSYALRQNDVTVVLSSPMVPGGELNDFINQHGDGIISVGLTCDSSADAHAVTTKNGATSYMEPTTESDDHGSIVISGIKAPGGDVRKLFIEHGSYNGAFLPGFQPWNPEFRAPVVGLKHVDHMVFNVDWDDMDRWAGWYKNVFGMDQLISFDDKDISTDYTALQSKVVTIDTGIIKYPINEPAVGKKKSQIEEYLDFNHGPGVQHLAIATDDCIATVGEMRKRGVEFLRVPDAYYDSLKDRVGEIAEDPQVLKELGILVDRDDKGYLLQIFTKPLTDRPTFFIEIIQRRGGFSFGKGNFKALFVSIEEEQRKRNTL